MELEEDCVLILSLDFIIVFLADLLLLLALEWLAALGACLVLPVVAILVQHSIVQIDRVNQGLVLARWRILPNIRPAVHLCIR